MDSGPSRPSDSELLRRARGGDHAAFHELVDRYAAPLLRLAAWWVGNAADAEDIVQETFSGVFRGLGGFKGLSSVKTWMTRILVRQVAMHRRRRREPIRLFGAESSAAEAYVPSGSHAADARMDVRAAIQALTPEHREVVLLREFQGRSYEQIAEVLGIPPGTVESRLFRARRAMQELLKDYLVEGAGAEESPVACSKE